MSEASAHFDRYGNGVIDNVPENGLLAGNRIISRRKSSTDGSLVFAMTDDYNAWQSVRLAEAWRLKDSATVERKIGQLATLAVEFPKFRQSDSDLQSRYLESLEQLLNQDSRPRDVNKRQAREKIANALEQMTTHGVHVPVETRRKILAAAVDLTSRAVTLDQQAKSGQERRTGLDRGRNIDCRLRQS
jgi:hypothetical protein